MKTKLEAYKNSIPIFGIVTLLYVLKEYEDSERYRECNVIVIAITEYNNTKLKPEHHLPTHISQIDPAEYLKHAAEVFNIKNFTPLDKMDGYVIKLKEYIDKR